MDSTVAARARATTVAAIGVLVAGALLRLVALSADPRYYAWSGHLTDEGRWTQQAREFALFRSLELEHWLAVVHLAVAPLYQAATLISFELFGVGFASARLVSAVAGIALLCAVWGVMRRVVSPGAALLTLVLVAFQRDLVFLSRVAVPEMAATLFEFLAFAVLVVMPRNARWAALAGVATAIGLGFKGTGFPILGVMALVIVVTHESDDPSGRLSRVGAYLLTVVGLGVAAAGVAEAATGLGLVGRIVSFGPALIEFVRPGSVYDMAVFLLDGDHTPALNGWLLGVWLLGGIVWASGGARGPARAIYIGSAAWAIGWLAAGAFLAYFPERYAFHAMVPIAVNIGSGIAILAERTRFEVDADDATLLLPLLWLSVPTAVVSSTLITPLLGTIAGSPERLSVVAGCLVLALAVVATAASRTSRPRLTAAALVVFPSIAALGWLAGSWVGWAPPHFWPDSAGWRWPLLVSGAGLLTWVAVDRLPALQTPVGLSVSVGLAIVAYAGLGLARSLPALTSPTYTWLSAAGEIQDRFRGEPVVWTDRGASVFLATDLKYRERRDLDAPAWLVDMFTSESTFRDGYTTAAEFEIELGEEHHQTHEVDPHLRILRRAR